MLQIDCSPAGTPGKCTRNPYCTKPAGHPGFCSGPKAAAEGRTVVNEPRHAPAAAATHPGEGRLSEVPQCMLLIDICFKACASTVRRSCSALHAGAYALHHCCYSCTSCLFCAPCTSEVNGCISSCLPPCCWPLTSAPWSCCRGCSCTFGEPDGCIRAGVIRDWTGDGCGEELDCGRHRNWADSAAQPCSGAAHPCSSGACCAEV